MKHLEGIYYLSKKDIIKAFETLVTINVEDYKNEEYYLTLATAYLSTGSNVMAYYYAERSLRFFINNNNILKTIDAEMIMLKTRESDGYCDFQLKVEEYEALIHTCDLCHAFDKKARVLHNLAYEFYNRNEYETAKRLYEQSMALKKKKSSLYLISLEGFIRCCLDGKLMENNELEKLVYEGISLAGEMKEYLFSIRFRLLLHLVNRHHTEYFNYLITNALPYFKKLGYVSLIKQYEMELFHYYVKKDETSKALELATKVLVD